MIISKTIKLNLEQPVTNEQIETALTSMGLNVLRWAVTGVDGEIYTIRISILTGN